ncbi:MAG TPA: V4R domain-containing protein [Desulfuromonadales bacterium]|nr:V4R domain-containing protein [Desulfuromonadales bacterium]
MVEAKQDYKHFSWEDLGDLGVGRPNLGLSVSVLVYRLMQYTLRDTLASSYDEETAAELFVRAGRLAGEQFSRNLLDTTLAPNLFFAQLQEVLRLLKIGLLRIERFDPQTMEMLVSMAEDLDCSGLPVTDETVCEYDEGFIAGILEAYTGRAFSVREIDCWANGDRVCRFEIRPQKQDPDE